MPSIRQRLRQLADWLANLPTLHLIVLAAVAVVLSHATLLRLPYYWDEGGYYIPAALDFYHRFALIPEFTNAHPPLPNVVLGTLWHITGYHILATRLLVSVFAAAALVAVFRVTQWLLGATAALAVVLLTAIYPIWFAQSTMAHADIFAAAFTLWAFALYFQEMQRTQRNTLPPRRVSALIVLLLSLAALSKETAIVEPFALALLHLALVARRRSSPLARRANLYWLVTFALPTLPLLAWFAYHRLEMGFTFGNPEYLRYNATDNFRVGHILLAFRYRAMHLFWQRNIWVPLALALACVFFLPRRSNDGSPLSHAVSRAILVIVAVNWIAFSVLGGALLTRYLLPVYPLLLLVSVAIWKSRTTYWPGLALVSAAGFLAVLWWNPPVAFAPEDNLTYRDMIVVHQEAIAYIEQHYADPRVLTSWPAAAELFRPDLGYTDRRIRVMPIENFSAASIGKAAQEPGDFDTALIFSKNFFAPALARYLRAHPDSKRGRDYREHRDLTPHEVALLLGGEIVFQDERNGEVAAVLRFPRSYVARLESMPLQTSGLR